MNETATVGQASRVLERFKILGRLKQALAGNACNVLLAGPWGSGKTTLLQQLQEDLAGETPRRYFTIEFSPWNQLGDEDPRAGFLTLLAATVLALNEQYEDRLGTLDQEAQGLWQAVCKLAQEFEKELRAGAEAIPGGRTAWVLGKFVCALWTQRTDLPEKQKNQQESQQAAVTLETAALRKRMCLLLRQIAKLTQTKGVLLLVEDLDRTRPEYAVATLESLYHLFMPQEHQEPEDEDWPLTSVWAVNISMLEEFLYAYYPHQPSFDPTAYLEKLFHRRINVPPLFHREPGAGPDLSEAATLWKVDFDDRCKGPIWSEGPGGDLAQRLSDPDTLEHLVRELSYAVLGNLRLYAAVRRLCIEYWTYCLAESTDSPQPFTPGRLERDARLITLIQAYPGFREDIALYTGMWPEFLKRVNERRRQIAFDAVRNPAYRHIDDPNLLTLLMDLEVLEWDPKEGLLRSNRDGEERVTRDLGDLLLVGF